MKRAVRTVIRILGAGLIVIGGLNLLLDYYIRHRNPNAEFKWSSVVLSSIAIVAGAVFLALSSRIANRVTEDYEE